VSEIHRSVLARTVQMLDESEEELEEESSLPG